MTVCKGCNREITLVDTLWIDDTPIASQYCIMDPVTGSKLHEPKEIGPTFRDQVCVAVGLSTDRSDEDILNALVEQRVRAAAKNRISQARIDQLVNRLTLLQETSPDATRNNASAEAIKYALEAEDGFQWLIYWNEGEFDICRNQWPDAPEECYIGADPAVTPTRSAELHNRPEWPMLDDEHLQALFFAYNDGYSKAYEGREFDNPFGEAGSQKQAWDMGTAEGKRNRARDTAKGAKHD